MWICFVLLYKKIGMWSLDAWYVSKHGHFNHVVPIKGPFQAFFRGITLETPIFSNLYNALSNIMNLIHALDNLLYITQENEEKQFVCLLLFLFLFFPKSSHHQGCDGFINKSHNQEQTTGEKRIVDGYLSSLMRMNQMVDSHVRLEKKRIVNVYLSPLMKMIQVVDSIIAKILSPSIFRETTFGLVFLQVVCYIYTSLMAREGNQVEINIF